MALPLNGAAKTVGRRPAESAGVAGSIALLVARIFGVKDPDTILAGAVVIGWLPAAVTWLNGLHKGER